MPFIPRELLRYFRCWRGLSHDDVAIVQNIICEIQTQRRIRTLHIRTRKVGVKTLSAAAVVSLFLEESSNKGRPRYIKSSKGLRVGDFHNLQPGKISSGVLI
jgi:hypothetical protein